LLPLFFLLFSITVATLWCGQVRLVFMVTVGVLLLCGRGVVIVVVSDGDLLVLLSLQQALVET
jgi:hypothetical protein